MVVKFDEFEHRADNQLITGLDSKGVDSTAMFTNLDSTKWSPYPSKVIFLLDVIDNLPRVQISGAFMKVLLWLLCELGIKEIPLFEALRKIQKSLCQKQGIPTISYKTPKGNAFSFNDLWVLVANVRYSSLTSNKREAHLYCALDPLVHPHIQRYPVIPKDGVISEIWHVQKWQKDLDRKFLSPMYDAGSDLHFFVDEPASLSNEEVVIPVRWLEDEKGEVWAEVWEVRTDMTTVIFPAYLSLEIVNLHGSRNFQKFKMKILD